MGRMSTACLLAAITCISAGTAFGQEACWEVVSSSGQASAPPYVMVNKCSGQTWQLVRTKGVDQNGTVQPNQWSWTWQPINMPSTPSQP